MTAVQVVLRVPGKPDFTPDHVDLAAPPPPGTTVDCGGARFTVQELVLRVRPAANGIYRGHYVAILAEPGGAADRDHAGLRLPCGPCGGPCRIDEPASGAVTDERTALLLAARLAGLTVARLDPHPCCSGQCATEYAIELRAADGTLWAEGTHESAQAVRWHIASYCAASECPTPPPTVCGIRGHRHLSPQERELARRVAEALLRPPDLPDLPESGEPRAPGTAGT